MCITIPKNIAEFLGIGKYVEIKIDNKERAIHVERVE